MDKDYIIFYPTPGYSESKNLFVRRMSELLAEKYYVVGIEEISNDLKKIKKVKAVFLNWMETSLDTRVKQHLILYKALGVKICWFFHNRVPHDCKTETQIKNMKWLADISNYIFILSHKSKEYVPNVKRNQKKCIYIPHINYIDAYPDCERNIREECGIKEDEFLFLFLGLIRPYKNIESLVQAFKELNLERAKLLIAGEVKDRKYMSELQKLCDGEQSIIVKPEFVSNREMEAFLRAGDVITLPYSTVSSMNSGAMIMAFSYGKTVIIPEIAMSCDIKGKEFAFIYTGAEAGDCLEQLKKKLSEAYEMGQSETDKMGKAAKNYMSEKNNAEQIWRAFEEIGI